MNKLECASCGATKNVHAVCHHCGQPLCADSRFCRLEISDNLFQGQPRAVHCFACAAQYQGWRPPEPAGGLDELFAWMADKLRRLLPQRGDA